MAESKLKIDFETRKKISDLVGDQGACTFCKISPRRGTIYMSKMGAIVCSSCVRIQNHLGNFIKMRWRNYWKNCFQICQDHAYSRKMIAKLSWMFKALNITRKTANTEVLSSQFIFEYNVICLKFLCDFEQQFPPRGLSTFSNVCVKNFVRINWLDSGKRHRMYSGLCKNAPSFIIIWSFGNSS